MMNEENSPTTSSNLWQENISLLKEAINHRGIETDIRIDDNYLVVVLKGSPQTSSAILTKELGDFINNLNWSLANHDDHDHSVTMVTLSAQDVTNTHTIWQIDFAIQPASINQVNHQPSNQSNILHKFTGIAGNLNKSVVDNSQAVWGNLSNTVKSAKNTVDTTSKNILETVTNTTKNVGEIATHTTENVKNTMSTTGQAIAESIDHTSKNIGQTVADTTKVTQAAILQTTTEAGKLVKEVPGHIGNTINFINKNSLSQNPFLKKLMGNIKVDWLLDLINQVDVVSAQNAVNNLKEAHPTETPRQIAHRIILEKAAYLASMGLVTSLVPGLSAALLTADLAATTAIYAETIYQIAGAYGLPLQDPARKGEILAVFGLTLGSNYAIKSGVGLLRNIPLAGAVIGAGSNAALLYSLGYVACNFYEAQVQPQNLEAGLEEIEVAGEMFLQGAIAQEIITDQILVHVYLAGNPGKTWQSVLSELEYLALSPASLQVLETLPELTPVEILLEQIQGDFAFALMAKCRAIAESDGVITPEEQQLLSLIQSKLKNHQIKNNWAEDLVKGAGKGLLDTFIDAKVSHSLLTTLTDIINGKKVANYDDLKEVLEQVDQMSGVDFEEFLAYLFRKKGYTVQMTPRTNDYGADLIISKYGKKTIVQAKRYASKLNNSPIQEAYTAIQHYQADDAMVITNNYFTANAQNLAQSNQVKLYDRDGLIKLIMDVQKK
jgi:HJR/Mrr/RecB family endonuclease/uncharacterized protein (DUF697 family)